MKRKRTVKDALSTLVGDIFETPAAVLPGGWSVTVTDGREAYVVGCSSILSYDESVITIDAGGRRIRIIGEGLDIARYCEGEITIRGKIRAAATDEDELC